MKAYVYNFELYSKYKHPSDMLCIISYLERNGKLNVSYETVEKLWEEFSSEEYKIDWVCVDEKDTELIEEFAMRLHKIEIEEDV